MRKILCGVLFHFPQAETPPKGGSFIACQTLWGGFHSKVSMKLKKERKENSTEQENRRTENSQYYTFNNSHSDCSLFFGYERGPHEGPAMLQKDELPRKHSGVFQMNVSYKVLDARIIV